MNSTYFLSVFNDFINSLNEITKNKFNRFLDRVKIEDKEVIDRIQNLKEDAGQKIESEKNGLMEELNSHLLDDVISKTKAMLKNDKNLNDEATKRIIEGVK